MAAADGESPQQNVPPRKKKVMSNSQQKKIKVQANKGRIKRK